MESSDTVYPRYLSREQWAGNGMELYVPLAPGQPQSHAPIHLPLNSLGGLSSSPLRMQSGYVSG